MPRRGLLPGMPATADGEAALIPPPMTMVPGLPPSRNTTSAGIGIAGGVDQGCKRPAVPQGRDIHQSGRKYMRFFQTECLGMVVGETVKIRVAPAAASPRVDPGA